MRVMEGAKVIDHGKKWAIGTGTEVNFWNIIWTDARGLYQYALVPLTGPMLEQNVNIYLHNYG